MDFEPTRAAALARLTAFVPHAGRDYTGQRNYDRAGHPHVSQLSPYLRHRIITEQDVLRAVLAQHSAQAADKFIAEVVWRTYWKGWLELRPAVWSHYTSELLAAWHRVQTEDTLRRDWEAACKGESGIDCFDAWAHELATTGYLHNHARMWFASIWIFTLRLPWALGADLFMRHLLDGDPASNTLSWRWVGGLQTVGKTYLATASNIAKFTDGRFSPKGLATQATPLDAPPKPDAAPCPQNPVLDPDATTGLLITQEDLSPDWLRAQTKPIATAALYLPSDPSPLQIAPQVETFKVNALHHATAACAAHQMTSNSLITWAQERKITQLVTPYVPAGPTAQTLAKLTAHLATAGIAVKPMIRAYDLAAWPHATAGFFKFKKVIPNLLSQL